MKIFAQFFSTVSKKPKVTFILGGPCSGKGTQSILINKRLGYKHLSAGQLLRQQRNNPSSKHAQLIQKTILDGKIVPSFITISLLQQAMDNNSKQYDKFLIDGFPRNIQNLQKWNQQMGHHVITNFIIFLTCSQETMINRLKSRAAISNRSDDNIQVIKKRFQTFQEQTLPVVELFRKTDKVIEVNVEGEVQEIFAEILTKIKDKQK